MYAKPIPGKKKKGRRERMGEGGRGVKKGVGHALSPREAYPTATRNRKQTNKQQTNKKQTGNRLTGVVEVEHALPGGLRVTVADVVEGREGEASQAARQVDQKEKPAVPGAAQKQSKNRS